jgi:hypothetical protein
LLRKALAPQPADRFASAREFAQALEPYTAGGAAELATLIQGLFGEDLRGEAARFGAGQTGGDGTTSGRVSP